MSSWWWQASWVGGVYPTYESTEVEEFYELHTEECSRLRAHYSKAIIFYSGSSEFLWVATGWVGCEWAWVSKNYNSYPVSPCFETIWWPEDGDNSSQIKENMFRKAGAILCCKINCEGWRVIVLWIHLEGVKGFANADVAMLNKVMLLYHSLEPHILFTNQLL